LILAFFDAVNSDNFVQAENNISSKRRKLALQKSKTSKATTSGSQILTSNKADALTSSSSTSSSDFVIPESLPPTLSTASSNSIAPRNQNCDYNQSEISTSTKSANKRKRPLPSSKPSSSSPSSSVSESCSIDAVDSKNARSQPAVVSSVSLRIPIAIQQSASSSSSITPCFTISGASPEGKELLLKAVNQLGRQQVRFVFV
jgi:hypothetical protein